MRAIILIGMLWSVLFAEPREALLIGNSNYQYISNLDDPSANLKRLKKSLNSVGFTNVTIKTNLNSENLENSIDNFVARLAKNSNAIGFLYYTGHGCQVDYQGYLVPTNVDTKKKLNIKYNALNINKLLEKFSGSGNRVNMLFLDACRDVPTGSKGGTKGLGQPLEKPKGSLVVYATEAGKVANDNSRFINALINNIAQPNQSIRDIADNISSVVAQQSSYSQVPEVFSKLLPKVVLKRGYISAPQPVAISVKPKPVVYNRTPIYQEVESIIHDVEFTKVQKNPTKSITIIGNDMWQDESINTRMKLNWNDAMKYCEDLELSGYSDWKLPSKDRLKNLYESKTGFNYDHNYYWSSTAVKREEGKVWVINFGDGVLFKDYQDGGRTFIRCVRDK